jgi:RNA polymerase sigma-70 factor (ECF subfamily)
MISKEEFKNVFDVHFDAIRSFVFYRCGDMALASDITQDVFMRIWEKRNALNGSYIKPLLYKMATDFYISSYRKNMSRMNFELSMTPENDTEITPEDELSFGELTAAYAKALEQMTDKQRTVFLMNREDGMKYAEIADCLHISVKTEEKHISAALRLLRTKLLYT